MSVMLAELTDHLARCLAGARTIVALAYSPEDARGLIASPQATG